MCFTAAPIHSSTFTAQLPAPVLLLLLQSDLRACCVPSSVNFFELLMFLFFERVTL